VVTLTFARWNLIGEFLRRIEAATSRLTIGEAGRPLSTFISILLSPPPSTTAALFEWPV